MPDIQKVEIEVSEENDQINNSIQTLVDALRSEITNESQGYESVWTNKEAKIIKDKILELVNKL
jgi:hypothetical protein